MEWFLHDLRSFSINTDQWTTAAQDDGKWRGTAEHGAERSMTKWIAAEKYRAELRHATLCPNVAGRTKERIPKASGLVPFRSPKLTSHKWREHISSGLCFADVMSSFSGVTLILFCFVFFFLLSPKPKPFVQSFFDTHAPRQPHAVT